MARHQLVSSAVTQTPKTLSNNRLLRMRRDISRPSSLENSKRSPVRLRAEDGLESNGSMTSLLVSVLPMCRSPRGN